MPAHILGTAYDWNTTFANLSAISLAGQGSKAEICAPVTLENVHRIGVKHWRTESWYTCNWCHVSNNDLVVSNDLCTLPIAASLLPGTLPGES